MQQTALNFKKEMLLLYFLFLGIILLSFVLADDLETEILYGGDSETIINSIGDIQNSITGYEQKKLESSEIKELGIKTSYANIFLGSIIFICIIGIIMILIKIDKKNKKSKS